MKKIIVLLVFSLITSFYGVSQTADTTASKWTFYGIDYTNTYFLTPLDFPNTDDLKAKITAWNDMILTERDKYSVDKLFNTTGAEYQFKMIKELNDQIDVESKLTGDITKVHYLNEAQVAEIVSKYNTSDDAGTGLVFIAESYYKTTEKGSYWVTTFDIATKKVIKTQRFIGKASGFGLRNYWANSYYVVMKEAGKTFNK